MGGLDKQNETASVGGNQVDTISVDAAAFLRHIYREVEENLEYITEIEGIEIPKVWQDKILQPIDFAIQVLEADTSVTDLASNNPEASAELSNPPKDMNTSKSLTDILKRFRQFARHNDSDMKLDSDLTVEDYIKYDEEQLAVAVAAIVEAVEGLAPKYRDNTDSKEWHPETDDSVSVGYNKAVDDFLQAIKEWQ